MWREWSRTKKIVVVVLVVLAAWELVGISVQVGKNVASGGGISNAFVPTGITPPNGYGGSNGFSFSCIESPSQFADCVSALITSALAGFFGQIQVWVSNFIANIFGSIFSWLVSTFNTILGAIDGAIAAIISFIGTIFASVFNAIQSFAAPFGPLSPIIVVTASLFILLAGGIVFYFVLIAMFAIGKTLLSLL